MECRCGAKVVSEADPPAVRASPEALGSGQSILNEAAVIN